jgi:hypothetical protein
MKNNYPHYKTLPIEEAEILGTALAYFLETKGEKVLKAMLAMARETGLILAIEMIKPWIEEYEKARKWAFCIENGKVKWKGGDSKCFIK